MARWMLEGFRFGRGRRRGGCDGNCAACCGDTLSEIAPGGRCSIRRLNGCGPTRQRLLDLGFQPGREVTVLRNAPLRDPIEVRVGDTFVALRRAEAAHVRVEVCRG